MGPLDHLDVSVEELGELVDGEVWRRWVDAEPLLDALASLTDLRKLRGQRADQLLGALVRLAARDGGDDELACKAVAHQWPGTTSGPCHPSRWGSWSCRPLNWRSDDRR